MEIATIQGESRKPEGRHANDRLRKRGLLPAIVYGHGKAPEMVALSRHDLELALQHQAHVINVAIDSKSEQYLIKDVQYDYLQKTPIHVDLMRVDPNERVTVKVPVVTVGTPKGVEHGGTLVHVATDLSVECPLPKIPEELRVHVEHLGLNDSLKVGDITLPEDVSAVDGPEEIIAVVHPPRGPVDEEEAEEGGEDSAEPEVIGKGPQEEEEDAGGE